MNALARVIWQAFVSEGGSRNVDKEAGTGGLKTGAISALKKDNEG